MLYSRPRLHPGTLIACLALGTALAATPGQEVSKESTVANRWGTFTLRIKSQAVETTSPASPLIYCHYSVFRNDHRLEPTCPRDGTLIGCDFVPPDKVRLVAISEGEEAAGWMLGVGGICGNTFSWQWTLVRPAKRGERWCYETCSFLAKGQPQVRRGRSAFEVWSEYQEWGQTGTALSFFVPERRLLALDPGQEPGIVKAVLPADITAWPKLKWQSPLGVYVAGIAQLNPDLMEAVAGSIDEGDDMFAAQGLPATRDGLLRLAAEVRETRRMADRVRQFRLDWIEYARAPRLEDAR